MTTLAFVYSNTFGAWHWICSVHREEDWCVHMVREIFTERMDKDVYGYETDVIVPIFPSADCLAFVTIGTEVVPGCAEAWMTYSPDFGSKYSIPLGLWAKGDGMTVIRDVIIDYMRGCLLPAENFKVGPVLTPCPQSMHTFAATNEIRGVKSMDRPWKVKCLWNIVFEKACTVCVEASSGGGNFGIDPDLANRSGAWTKPTSAPF